MSGGSKINTLVQFPNDWVPPREITSHWNGARDAIGEMLFGDPLGENRLPGAPLVVPLLDVCFFHPLIPDIERAMRIVKDYSIVSCDSSAWAGRYAFPSRCGSTSIVVSDFRPHEQYAFSPSKPSLIEERFSGEMWHFIPKPSKKDMALIDGDVLEAISILSGTIWEDAREVLCRRYGNAVWLSRVCEQLMAPDVRKYVKKTMEKVQSAMLTMVGPLIQGVEFDSDSRRRIAALNVLHKISPRSFAIHDNLLIGVFDMLNKVMRNQNIDIVSKASLAAKLGKEHGKQRPDIMEMAAEVLFEAMAVVHGGFVGVDDSDRARLESYDAQMEQLLGMYGQMTKGMRHPDDYRNFFTSLQLNARTEGVKAAAGLFVN